MTVRKNIRRSDVPENQWEQILWYLKFKGNASTSELQSAFGMHDPRKRISELRKAGYNINANKIAYKNIFGNDASYHRYSSGKPLRKKDIHNGTSKKVLPVSKNTGRTE